ncbi:MAG TPA: GH25 family lysozyme [Gemmatimonadaceae bacterium]|nr:GH25 family lysozyme [Gemmatimonadaceae bacterium]
MAELEGVDVSHRNLTIDWTKVKRAGISFAMVKATEGTDWIDPTFTINVSGARDAGIVVGVYHFYRHDADPALQATSFLKATGHPQPGDLLPALDVEAPGDGAGPITYSTANVVRRIGEFVDAVEAALSVAPMIYTYPSAWKEITGNADAFASKCPLWIASYADAPTIPGGWHQQALWQYTDKGTVNGISTIVDRDRTAGDLAALESLRTRALAVGEMAVFTQDGNVRAAASLAARVVGTLPRGTGVVVVDGPELAKDREWWKVDDGEGVVGWSSGKVLSAG